MDTREKVIRQMHAQGATMTDIGRRLGVSRERVRQLANLMGLAWPKAMPQAERWQRIPPLMRQGLTYSAIAERLGVHVQVIAKDVRTMPESRRLRREQRQAKPSTKRRAQIAGLIEQGLAMPEIAKRLGVSTSTIFRDIRGLNLSKRQLAKLQENARFAQYEHRAS